MTCPTCGREVSLHAEAHLLPDPDHGGFDALCPDDSTFLAWLVSFHDIVSLRTTTTRDKEN